MLPPLLFSVRIPTLLARFWRTRVSRHPYAYRRRKGPLSFIIFRLDGLGDLVMTTPLFREIKRAYPNSRCTVVVPKACRSLLATNPHVDEILTVCDRNQPGSAGRARALLFALLFYWRHLRHRQYDAAISPRWDVDEHLATFLCLLTHARERIGYSEKTTPLKQQLNRGFSKAYSICLPPARLQHEVMQNLAIVKTLGGVVEDTYLEIHLTDRDRQFAARLLAAVAPSKKLVALGIGAFSASRQWPLQRYADVIALLSRALLVQPVVFCAAGERLQAETLASLLTVPPLLVCGQGLRDVCAVLERCDLFIGNDSGTAHLAAAMNCKTFVISRHPADGDPNHGNSPRRFAPHCQTRRVFQPQKGLDGCTLACRSAQPHCITTVRPEEVAAAAQKLLQEDRVPPPPITRYTQARMPALKRSLQPAVIPVTHVRRTDPSGLAVVE